MILFTFLWLYFRQEPNKHLQLLVELKYYVQLKGNQ